jgi:hypothetical protein
MQATGQKSSCPHFTGDAVLDGKFVDVEDKESCPGQPFDVVIRLSTLEEAARHHDVNESYEAFSFKDAIHGLNTIATWR